MQTATQGVTAYTRGRIMASARSSSHEPQTDPPQGTRAEEVEFPWARAQSAMPAMPPCALQPQLCADDSTALTVAATDGTRGAAHDALQTNRQRESSQLSQAHDMESQPLIARNGQLGRPPSSSPGSGAANRISVSQEGLIRASMILASLTIPNSPPSSAGTGDLQYREVSYFLRGMAVSAASGLVGTLAGGLAATLGARSSPEVIMGVGLACGLAASFAGYCVYRSHH